jgi:NADPH2:quinone reductase
MCAVVTALNADPAEAVASIQLEPQPPIDVSALSANDVVIAVRSSAAHWVDMLMMSGQYQHQPEPPYTPGMEYAGEIAWRGADVTHVKEGDRVMIDGFKAGARSYDKRYQKNGGFSSFAVAPSAAARHFPSPEWTFDQAANYQGAYETAYVTRSNLVLVSLL